MSYVAVESNVETMLKSAFETALDAADLTCAVHGWWIDDASGDTEEEIEFPQVNIAAAPNVPDGWRQPLRFVPVTVEIITFAADDKKRQTLAAIYYAIREVIDTATFESDQFEHVPAVFVETGGDVLMGGSLLDPELYHVVRMELTVHVCLGPQT